MTLGDLSKLRDDRLVRLTELGYTLPEAPPPAAIYQPYMMTGNQLWIAGQIAIRDGALLYEGQVGASVTLDQARACAELCALNLLAQLKRAQGSLDALVQITKLNVFVASSPEFYSQHLVANAASELLGTILGNAGVHARFAVGVSALPLNSPVEIDAVFEVKPLK
jgi:enamine deaminase RidA (YjgF/YER057c/UK114 family)